MRLSAPAPAKPPVTAYDLASLVNDQDLDLFTHTVAPLVTWLDPNDTGRPAVLPVRMTVGGVLTEHTVHVSWSVPALEAAGVKALQEDIRRFREGRTVHLERRTELAALGLAFVGASCLFRRRILQINFYSPPDLLFDATPTARRGIEVSGRATGGNAALRVVLEGATSKKRRRGKRVKRGKPGKRLQLRRITAIAEAHVALWCGQPLMGRWEQVKP